MMPGQARTHNSGQAAQQVTDQRGVHAHRTSQASDSSPAGGTEVNSTLHRAGVTVTATTSEADKLAT